MQRFLIIILAVTALLASDCAAPSIKLFPDATDPLREFTLQGTEKGKVLGERGRKGDADKKIN